MRCPVCEQDDNRVVRSHSENNFQRPSNLRTRQCTNCGVMFYTREKLEGKPFVIVKREEKEINHIDEIVKQKNGDN